MQSCALIVAESYHPPAAPPSPQSHHLHAAARAGHNLGVGLKGVVTHVHKRQQGGGLRRPDGGDRRQMLAHGRRSRLLGRPPLWGAPAWRHTQLNTMFTLALAWQAPWTAALRARF